MSPSSSSPAPPPPPTPTRSHSWPSAEPGPGPSTSLNLNLGLNLKSGTSKIIGSLKRSFSTKSQVAKEGAGLTRRHRPSASASYHDHAPDAFLSSSPSSASTAAPTVSQIAMGLHLSRTPHIPTRLEPYTSPHHPHRLHHHHPHPHPHARHQHHNPGLTKFSNASWASRPPARVRQRHSYQPGPAHARDVGGVDGHDYVNKPASNLRHASDSTVRQTVSKNPKAQSTSLVSHAHPLPPPPSRSAMKKRPSPISVSVSVPSLSPQPHRNDRYGDGEDRTLTSTPASSSLSGSLTTLESVMSGTTATSYTLPGPGTPTTPTSLDGTVKQAGLVGKLGLSRFLGARGAGGVGAGRMSALEEMRARDGKRGNGSEGSLSVGGVSQSPSTMTSASTSTGTGTSMGGGGVRKAVRFDFVDVDGRADVES